MALHLVFADQWSRDTHDYTAFEELMSSLDTSDSYAGVYVRSDSTADELKHQLLPLLEECDPLIILEVSGWATFNESGDTDEWLDEEQGRSLCQECLD